MFYGLVVVINNIRGSFHCNSLLLPLFLKVHSEEHNRNYPSVFAEGNVKLCSCLRWYCWTFHEVWLEKLYFFCFCSELAPEGRHAEVTLSQILRPNLDFSPFQTIRPWQPQLWPWTKRLSPDFSRDSAVEWRLSRLSLQTLYKYSRSSPFLHVERVRSLTPYFD